MGKEYLELGRHDGYGNAAVILTRPLPGYISPVPSASLFIRCFFLDLFMCINVLPT